MAKVTKSKKAASVRTSNRKKRAAESDAAFDPVEWLIRTHPATASWLGHDLTKERGRRLKPDCLIMHPGPINRGVEIDSELADGPQSVILEQVTNGVAAQMMLYDYDFNDPAVGDPTKLSPYGLRRLSQMEKWLRAGYACPVMIDRLLPWI